MKEYKKAPEILTGKDLDYLKDIFGWSYNIYKIGNENVQYIEDKEIIKFYLECNNLFYENMNTILNILENGGKNE